MCANSRSLSSLSYRLANVAFDFGSTATFLARNAVLTRQSPETSELDTSSFELL